MATIIAARDRIRVILLPPGDIAIGTLEFGYYSSYSVAHSASRILGSQHGLRPMVGIFSRAETQRGFLNGAVS